MLIKKAQITDLNAMANLLLQLGYSATEAQLHQYLDDPKRSDEIYLAESEGAVVGLISIGRVGVSGLFLQLFG
ncbi:hypothetical protein [Shewanella mangrovisoli]|uniref:hypothetical protein n=1 Tax=Shewanella mangrovisoli TaxID=2864211 RepID=UPI0021AD2A7A|nr:hypothetical protein [Shewanella mangrovisoli]